MTSISAQGTLFLLKLICRQSGDLTVVGGVDGCRNDDPNTCSIDGSQSVWRHSRDSVQFLTNTSFGENYNKVYESKILKLCSMSLLARWGLGFPSLTWIDFDPRVDKYAHVQ